MQVEITHQISYIRSSQTLYECNNTTIAMQLLLGNSLEHLVCQEGCTGVIGTMQFYCTDFSVEDDWSVGQRTYMYSTLDLTYFEAS